MNYDAIALWSEVASSVLFVVALVLVWNKFIEPAVLRAQANKNAQIAEAERHRDEARAALEGLQREVEGAQRDALAIKERVAALSAAERDAALREAREAGERTLRDADGELDRARAAAREQLRDELLDEALAAARASAVQRVDTAVNQKLVASFVESLAGSHA